MLWLWTILSSTAAFFVILWFVYQIYNRHILQLCRAIPSAQPCYPLLGNILSFVCSIEKMTETGFKIIGETVYSGQRAVCFWIGPLPLIIITNADDIKKVLNNSLSRGREVEESCNGYMKYGLLTSPVDHWKITRRHLNLSFHTKNLVEFMPIINSTSRQLVADLSGLVGGPSFNILPLVMSVALRADCSFLYGPETVEYISSDQLNDLRRAVEMVTELVILRQSRPWLKNDTLFKIFHGKKIDFVKTACYKVMMQVANIDSFQSQPSRFEGARVHTENAKAGFQTILDAMLNLREKCPSLTDQHIMEEIISFFVTGTDTVGASVSSCFLALAYFTNVQNKVYEEICSELSEKVDITIDDLNRLTYLDRVIKETLRFFTVVPFTSREPSRDIDLGGYSIPAKSFTLLCISAVGFDPKYFYDPFKFDPDRFLKPNNLDDSMFMPFSRGPRNCIGKEYAMMLMKVMVAKVVRKYTVSTNMDVQNLKRRYTMVITPSEGYNVFLKKRSE